MTQWKKLKDYGGEYYISDRGEIRSLVKSTQYPTEQERRLKPALRPDGYLHVHLGGRKGRTRLLHRLVAETFLPNPKNLPQVHHKDFNKQNNSVNNLKWVTAKQNLRYTTEAGRRRWNGRKGEDCHFSILKEPDVVAIRNTYAEGNISSRALAMRYKVSQFAILQIVRRNTWKHI